MFTTDPHVIAARLARIEQDRLRRPIARRTPAPRRPARTQEVTR